MTTSKLLLVVAVVCFILAGVGVEFGPVGLGWLGLAFFAGSGLVT